MAKEGIQEKKEKFVVFAVPGRSTLADLYKSIMRRMHHLVETKMEIIADIKMLRLETGSMDAVKEMNRLAHEYNLCLVVGEPTILTSGGAIVSKARDWTEVFNIEASTSKSKELLQKGSMKESIVNPF